MRETVSGRCAQSVPVRTRLLYQRSLQCRMMHGDASRNVFAHSSCIAASAELALASSASSTPTSGDDGVVAMT
jgi:hypothetical protein